MAEIDLIFLLPHHEKDTPLFRADEFLHELGTIRNCDLRNSIKPPLIRAKSDLNESNLIANRYYFIIRWCDSEIAIYLLHFKNRNIGVPKMQAGFRTL